MNSSAGLDDTVRLAPASHDDLVAMAEGGVPAAVAHRLEPGSLPPPFVAARSLEHRQQGASWDWCGLFYVVDAASERIVGSCGFKSEPRLGVVEIGYGIAPAARGRGRATAAVRQLLDMALRLDPDVAVLAQVNPQNLASTTVVRRLAFRHAGQQVDAEGEALVQWIHRVVPTSPRPDERLAMAALLDRTKDNPWRLKTPPGSSDYTMHVDEKDGRRILVCTVGSTVLHYDARCVDDLHAMLKAAGDWVDLGGADEQKPAKDGTVEAWGRSPDNPVGGWYGLKRGLRGRFGVYLPPLLEALGLCELEHQPKNNRMRAR